MTCFTKDSLRNFIKPLADKHIHASNILKKLNDDSDLSFLLKCADKYRDFCESFDLHDLKKTVKAWNAYLDFVRKENKSYSAQSKFESTILEESIYRMFADLENENIKIGQIKAYSNLYFCPYDFESFQRESRVKMNVKDQDFAIYKKVSLSINDAVEKIDTFVPVIAIECKTYLDKTMLEGSIATAEKIKIGNPYCRFCIVTEFYEVDKNVDIKHSRIDQIYVLNKDAKRKTSISSNIQTDVVERIYKETNKHLRQKWSDVENNIKNNGIVID
ncbi:MAG: Bpu10I family restriction endonuclease [Elusimicrobiota bacterium]|jgi:hypothetical protein|nr:Bpu10I family restriction endonuclease [Elusimicrobiota bacterium]